MSVLEYKTTSSADVFYAARVLGEQSPLPRELSDWSTSTVQLDLRALLLATATTPSVWVEVVPAVMPTVQEALEQVKRLAGLTWEQVARLLGVHRRSVHNWLRGSPLASEHEERLYEVLDAVKLAAEGRSAHETRAWIRDRSRGSSVVDLLMVGHFPEARAVAQGAAIGTAVKITPTLGEAPRRGPLTAIDLLETPAPVELPPPRVKRTIAVRRQRRSSGA
jgi:transcriptional regulator with XRE-family HTH domain